MTNKPNAIVDLKNKPGLTASTPVNSGLDDKKPGGWERFWFTAADPIGLHVLRVLAGLLFLSFLLPLAGHIDAFFTLNGWFDGEAYREASRLPFERRPLFGWSLLFVYGASSTMAHAFFWTTIGILVCFTLGLALRITSILTWVCVTSFVAFLAGPLAGHPESAGRTESDLLILLSFYFMIAYVLLGQFSRPLTLMQRLIGTWDTFVLAPLFKKNQAAQTPVYSSYAANLAVRLFQVHFALIVATGCLHKLQIGDWWTGVALWYPLHPPFETTAEMIHRQAHYAPLLLFLYSLAGYLELAWQLTFPLWAWRTAFRPLLLAGAAIAWLGCAWLYELPAVGPFYFLGCLAFLTPAEWRRIAGLFGGARGHLASAATARRDEKVTVAV